MSGVVTRPGTPPRPAVVQPLLYFLKEPLVKAHSGNRTAAEERCFPHHDILQAVSLLPQTVISHVMKTEGKAQTFEPLLKVPGLKLCHQYSFIPS